MNSATAKLMYWMGPERRAQFLTEPGALHYIFLATYYKSSRILSLYYHYHIIWNIKYDLESAEEEDC